MIEVSRVLIVDSDLQRAILIVSLIEQIDVSTRDFERLFGNHDDNTERMTTLKIQRFSVFATPAATRRRIQHQLSIVQTWVDM
jgi:hypothetical protein